jgi:gas vesicle protein
MTNDTTKNKPGLTSLIIGAAIGAAAVTLSSKKNRDMIADKVSKAMSTTKDKVEETKEMVEDFASKKVEEISDSTKNAMESTKEAFKTTSQKVAQKGNEVINELDKKN